MMSEKPNNENQDLYKDQIKLQEIKDNNDKETVKELLNVIDFIDSELVSLNTYQVENWEGDESKKILWEIYSDFKKDVNEIMSDWIIWDVEKLRLDSINNIIDWIIDSSVVLSTLNNEFLSNVETWEILYWKNIDLPKFKSIKQLVYSRDVLDNISDDKEWINWLKIILSLIEDVWTSNIKDSDLKEVNTLIEEIFEDWLEVSDIVKLNKLQSLLLLTYNTEQNQKYENFSIGKGEARNVNEDNIKDTQEILDFLARLDSEYMDKFNEKCPTLWNFLDSVSVEVKKWLIDWDFNTLGWSIKQIIESFSSIERSFDDLLENPSMEKFLSFNDRLKFNFSVWLLSISNSLRHIIPESLNLIFISAKEFKNYYIKSTWAETGHWVFLQMMHEMRDDVKYAEYSWEWLWNIASEWAEIADNTVVDSLSVFNWWSDAVLDFSWTILNTLFLPEKTFDKIYDFCWNISWNMDLFEDFISSGNISQEKISKSLYIASYLTTYISATFLIPWLALANDKVWKLVEKFAELLWRPISQVSKIIDKAVSSVKKSDDFQKTQKLVNEVISKNDILSKSIKGSDRVSWRVTWITQTNSFQNSVDYNINLNAS